MRRSRRSCEALRGLLIATAVVVAGCAAGPAVRMPGAVVDPMAGVFAWAVDRPLTWADFRGRPDLMSPAVALSAYVISYDTACDGRGRFTPAVVSRFLPAISWVKADHLLIRQSAQTLKHEQTHFDISEVQARRGLQDLRALDQPCARSSAEFDRLLESYGRRAADLQQQYDRETGHGTDIRRQQEWESRVDGWLQALPR